MCYVLNKLELKNDIFIYSLRGILINIICYHTLGWFYDYLDFFHRVKDTKISAKLEQLVSSLFYCPLLTVRRTPCEAATFSWTCSFCYSAATGLASSSTSTSRVSSTSRSKSYKTYLYKSLRQGEHISSGNK
jgi:hypothetical protein